MDSLNTITLPEFTDLVRREFEMVGSAAKPTAMALFIKDDVGLNNGEFRLYQEYDHDLFASFKGQAQNVKKGKVGVGYSITATVNRYGTEIDITDEMRKFNKYRDVISKLTSLTSYATNRLELDLNHRITFATSTTYTDRDGRVRNIAVGDGLSLANAAHTLKYSATTWSNLVSGAPAFSQAGLEAAELVASTQVYNNFGEKITKKFNKIFFADNPTVANAVLQLLHSTASVVDYKNAGVTNPYANKYVGVMLPYLASTATSAYDATKKNWWGIVAAGGNDADSWQAYLAMWENPYLVDPMSMPSLVDGHADVWTYGVRVSYDTAIVSGRGFVLSPSA